MPLDANTRLGPYEILALLGEGGMGEVYRGRDTRLGRPVAIKVVHTEFSARFESEARAISALNHPNICTLYDIGTAPSGFGYLVMELVEGESLAARLLQGPVPVDQAVRVAISIADALSTAHAAGVVHRDLKPANIMITPERRVKLLDFGLAKLEDKFDSDITRTAAGEVMGTFAYMSPEQVRGSPADARSDIFAFGAVLHEMLSGERAFSGQSAMMVAAAVVRDQPKPLRDVPTELTAVVARCLRKNPSERFPRIAEVKAALEGTLGRAAPAPAMELPRSHSGSSRSLECAPFESPSIAVLPFANLSGDKDNEYFSDGLAEEILNALARVPGLKVTARTSAFAFRGEKQHIRTIGQALGVGTVLEGSVRRAGNRIRVTAQLINTSDGYQLWSERYDRDMTDVFAVQDEIGQSIVDTLKLRLAPAPCCAVDLDAYHAYLKSVYHFFRVTPEDLALAIRYAEEAAALDPSYAPAQVQRALCCFQLADIGVKPFREMMTLARSFAMKAIEIDESLAETHAVLARVAGHLDYDWSEASRQCRLALDHGCSASPSTSLTITVLCPLRRFDEALAVCQTGIAADPLSPVPRLFHANVLAARGSFDAAIEEVRGVLSFQDFHFAHYVLGLIYTTNGQSVDAIASLEKFVQLAPWNSGGIGLLAGNCAKAGDDARAEALLARLAAPEHALGRALGHANYHVILEQFDQAADEYEKMIEARHSSAVFNSFIPLFETFRRTNRGRALMAKMNLA